MKHDSILDSVPHQSSSLLFAYLIQQAASRVGMDWKHPEDIKMKLTEELNEFEQASSPADRIDEFGDILFTIVNYGRALGINPDEAMQIATSKFTKRLREVERMVEQGKQDWSLYSLEELDELWQRAKKNI